MEQRRMTVRIGFIGLGIMGRPMGLNLIKAAYPLSVYARRPDMMDALAHEGATACGSPQEVASQSDVIITMVSDTPDVEHVILGERGIIHGAQPDSVVIDMSTISPSATRRMAETLSKQGIQMLDAPVSGGEQGAIDGTLSIMVGGDATDVDRAMPILEAMGNATHVGATGAGQITKAINQIIIAGTYVTVAEGLTLGMKAGLDMEKVLQAIWGGAASSWVLHNRGINVVKNEYPLGFRLRLHHKDLKIALDEGRELGVTLPATALVAQIENGLMARGYGDDDVSAIGRAIREQSGVE